MAIASGGSAFGPGRDTRRLPLAAARAEPGVVVALLFAAGVAWWWTSIRMSGMDAGPGTDLGTLGWFIGVWAVMMAAMMLPSLAPTAAVFAGLARDLGRVLLFASGYLIVWIAAGLSAYAGLALGKSLLGGSLPWHSSGRPLAAGVLALAAAYQLTPLKRAFLSTCRSPERSLSARWQDSRRGALVVGLRSGGACLGCSWALMAALFALGVMSLTWMVVIALLVALEKAGPWGHVARLGTAGVLVVLAALILAAPHDLPGLVLPGSSASSAAMSTMSVS